jgi:hypothetical protein
MLGRHIARNIQRSLKSKDTRDIEDPASISTWERGLLDHLCRGVFAAEKDARGVYGDVLVPDFLREVPDRFWVAGFKGDAGIVYHSMIKPQLDTA